MNTSEQVTTTDVLIIGAGIAGISAAYHLKKYRPNSSFLILEGRENRWHLELIPLPWHPLRFRYAVFCIWF